MLGNMTGNRTKINGNHGKYMIVLYTEPRDCGGNCIFCPSYSVVTKSTIPNEDTLMAKIYGWSSVAQFSQRCKDAEVTMNSGNKFALLIKGNSFTNYSADYLEQYIKDIYDYLNLCSGETFEDSFRMQKSAKDKCVQITIETRPDLITEEWCQRMQYWGIRTVEIGVQAIDDNTLHINNRGHDVNKIIEATRMIRKYGFELGYQVMLGLYGSTEEQDFNMLTKELWTEEFYPDSLKIYPCLLLQNENAQKLLYDLYHAGKWRPITDENYNSFLLRAVPYFPCDVHVNRLQRIFSENEVNLGPKKNIDRKKFKGLCKSMWQRSVQNSDLDLEGNFEDYRIISFTHDDEVCVQAIIEDGTLIGYARLSLHKNDAVIRDLRVLGIPLKVGYHNLNKVGTQHIGIGKELLRYMELYAQLKMKEKILINSSAGCVGYFEMRGYKLVNHYSLYKSLTNN